jgi:hypothetical protein
MEVAEALCESVAIVDRGRMVVGGPLRDVRRSTGRRMVRLSVAGDPRLPWLAGVPGARVIQAGMDRSMVELEAGLEPDAVLAAAVAAGARVTHFEVADPTLEQVFIERHALGAGTGNEGPAFLHPDLDHRGHLGMFQPCRMTRVVHPGVERGDTVGLLARDEQMQFGRAHRIESQPEHAQAALAEQPAEFEAAQAPGRGRSGRGGAARS